ncbi:hypothetical protein [Aeromonas simiae]|uniref:hypothetical protein n=1 Tax=Aeromonas simiae TaxID=218936 RepID=UPI00266D6750|nr:hypothetical protein [Aeromonas simiae]MDO2953873.1 hypothetical protein [Aeromonas simiae]
MSAPTTTTSPVVNHVIDEGLCQSPTMLPFVPLPEAASNESFAAVKSPCSAKEFEDIFYVSGSNCFWLVEKKAFKKIKMVVSEFESKVLGSSSKLQALAAQGIQLDSLMISPTAYSFLTPAQQQEWNSIQASRSSSLTFSPYGNNSQAAVYKRVSDHAAEDAKRIAQLEQLKRQGIEQAKAQGYEVDNNGHYYDPRQVKIGTLLAQYNKARATFVAEKPPAEQIESLRQAVLKTQTLMQEHSYGLMWPSDDWFSHRQETLAKMTAAQQTLNRCISELGALGVAVPEFALSGIEGCVAGDKCYASWYAYLAQKKQAEEELEKTTKAFLTALDSGYAASSDKENPLLPPQQMFQRQLDAINAAHKQANELYEKALLACSRQVPPRVLAWEGEYQRQPMDVLTKGDYPLREICSAALSVEPLSYFSLWQLPVDKVKERAGDLLKLEQDPVLLALLAQDGITPLPLQKGWFYKESGALNFDKVADYLEQKNIKVKALDSWRSRFAEHLGTLLYRSDKQVEFGPFDESPQAQLMRMMSYSDWKGKLSSSGKIDPPLMTLTYQDGTVSMPGPSASLSVTAEFYPLRGEIDLFRITLPRGAKPTIATLIAPKSGNKYQINLGTWAVDVHAKAWGKAGAMLKAGREASLNASVGGISLSGLDVAVKAEEKGEFTAEVGAEVGCSLSGRLLWRPDSSMIKRLGIVAEEAKLPLQLCKATTGLKAEIKDTLSEFPFILSWRNNRMRLGVKAGVLGGSAKAKGYFEFEVDWQSTGYVVAMFQDLLRRCNYERVEVFADEESYQRLSRASQLALLLGVNIGQIVAAEKDFVDRIYGKLNRSQNAGLVAWTLSGHLLPKPRNPNPALRPDTAGDAKANAATEAKLKVWANGLLPEALGSLLGTLVANSKVLRLNNPPVNLSDKETHVLQQMTIARLVDWLYSGKATTDNCHKFQEAISRMTDINVQDQIGAYKRNLSTLDKYMALPADSRNDDLKSTLIKYRRARNVLSNMRWENAQPNYKISNTYGRSQIQDGWNVKS